MPRKTGFRRFTSFQNKIKNKGLASQQPGAAPGTIEHIGEQRIENIIIDLYNYDEDYVEHQTIDTIEDCEPFLEQPSITWINVQGLHDIEKLKPIWDYFELHPLMQEDIANTAQRPKVEHYENYSFFVVRMLHFSPNNEELQSEQISIVLGKNLVLSFQESDRKVFNPIYVRLNRRLSRIREAGPDYLAYALIDTVVDHYFNLLAMFGEQIEDIEEQLMKDPDSITFQAIHDLRKKVIYSKKTIWPLRDMLNTTIREKSPFIEEPTKIYLRDVYDHVVQIIDNMENYRDMIRGTHDMFTSHMSNKMNEVMKVLTIIATIFIPLTFIAGVYGMNFQYMPELTLPWAYPAVLASMAVVGVVMLIYFKKKDWL